MGHYDNTPYAYNNPIHSIDPLGLDTILVNSKSGELIDTKEGGEDYVFVTNKNKASEKAWKKSKQLFYALNINGESGGTPNKKGDPVIWSALKDQTESFNALLNQVTDQFELEKAKIEGNDYSVSGNEAALKRDYEDQYFDDNQPLDIKQHLYHPKRIGEWSWYNGRLARYDDYGNLLYGSAGSAIGLSKSTLTTAAEIN